MTVKKPAALSSESNALHYVTRFIVALVAIGAAILSFDALTALAYASGIRIEFAWIWAILIDGFIFVATLAAFVFRERTGAAKYYTWVVLGTFVSLSIVGNAWHAAIVDSQYILPLWVKVTVTAVPPLALFLAIHLLVLMVSPTPEQKLEFKRQHDHAERLNRLREKEIEKIEKQAIIREVKERSALHVNQPQQTETTVPAQKPVTSVNIPAPKTIEAKSSTSTISEPTDDEIKTEEEVKAILDQMVSDGIALPSGKTVSEWLGKSERTGQNFMKAYKASLEAVE